MTPQELVSGIRSAVIEENMAIFERLFTTTAPEKATDAYWKRALALFNGLSPADKVVLFEIIRNTAVATTSHLLGVLDGENPIAVDKAELKLLDAGDRQLNGELQNIFLIEEEKRSQ